MTRHIPGLHRENGNGKEKLKVSSSSEWIGRSIAGIPPDRFTSCAFPFLSPNSTMAIH